MLIISRHRQASEYSAAASQLAVKFNTVVQSVPFLYDCAADSPLVQRLRLLPEPAYFVLPMSLRSATNLLNHLQIPYADVFETEETVQIPDGGISGGQIEYVDETPKLRWYPIIDDSRCTACLECVNYCLFGVYAIGNDSRPFVDQPDACRDGCPACARVCLGKAIMFPLYEDRVIAGYEEAPADDLNNLIDLVDQI